MIFYLFEFYARKADMDDLAINYVIYRSNINSAVPDLTPSSAGIQHFFQIRLRQKSHRSRIVLPDTKSRLFPDII